MLSRMKEEFSTLTVQERLFLLFAMLCGFFISAEYAVIRPVSNAVFLTAFGASYFPYAWMATIPLNVCVVALYNKYLPRLGCFRMFLCVAATVMVGSVLCAFYLHKIPALSFLFYVWKEIYIMLMFQQLWSVIHSVIPLNRAKYLYGILFGVGASGAVAGSVLPSFLAVRVGSESLLLMTIPLYLCLIGLYHRALKHTAEGSSMSLNVQQHHSSLEAFWHGMRLIANSRYLLFILSIVVLMQVCAALIDFQFNLALEKTILDKDLRTQFTGRLLGLVHLSTIGLQLIGSFILVQWLGMKRSHFLIPLLLCINSVLFYFFPLFSVISISFVTIKSCDFSVFSVIKEMLYIPLSPDEKFRAKAIIDVFAHRSSKALASLLVLMLSSIIASSFSIVLNLMTILLFIVWLLIVVRLFRFKQVV